MNGRLVSITMMNSIALAALKFRTDKGQLLREQAAGDPVIADAIANDLTCREN